MKSNNNTSNKHLSKINLFELSSKRCLIIARSPKFGGKLFFLVTCSALFNCATYSGKRTIWMWFENYFRLKMCGKCTSSNRSPHVYIFWKGGKKLFLKRIYDLLICFCCKHKPVWLLLPLVVATKRVGVAHKTKKWFYWPRDKSES